MSESYRAFKHYSFATGQTLTVGEVYRDRSGPIRDTYRLKGIRKYRRSGLCVVLTIIRREGDGQVTEPLIEVVWPVAALFDGRIVRAEESS